MIDDNLLRCSTSHGDFVLRSSEVRHVSRVEHMRPADEADGRVGALNLGCQLVPVFSLTRAMGLPDPVEAAPGDQHIAVTDDGAKLTGWLVDKLTREPASDVKVAPMPSTIGARAARWFESVVTCANGAIALLLDPRELSPLGTQAAPRESGEPRVAAAARHSSSAEPVALVFSTPVLPPSPIEKFALSGRQVAAIVQPAPTIAVPGCAPHVSGVTLWRDLVVPVVDYREEVRDHLPHWRRLIARCGHRAESLIAFAIHDDVQMHRPAADHRPVEDVPRPPFASGVFDVNGDPVALLDVDALARGAC